MQVDRSGISAGRHAEPVVVSVRELMEHALRAVASELPELTVLPERRYDTSLFPTIGQYDWALGQVLYALVRHVKPRRVIEFSTSSGYSTSFTALALKRNGTGILDTVDIDGRAQEAAARWLDTLGVGEVVRMHTGDCRAEVPRLLGRDVDLLFIDTLHSFDIAEWYLCEIVPRLDPDVLVHIHDVMPPEARVRIHGGPPYPSEPPAPRLSPWYLVKRAVWLLLHGEFPNPFPAERPREILPLDRLEVHASGNGTLPTIDGNYFEEAVLIRDLLRDADPADVVYVHRLIGELPLLNPQAYAHLDRIQRSDAFGSPLEWNDALWCRAGTLQRAAAPRRVSAMAKSLRDQFARA